MRQGNNICDAIHTMSFCIIQIRETNPKMCLDPITLSFEVY